MPIPKPNPKESKDDFIGRCISTMKEKDPKRSNEQIAAICYDSWRKSTNPGLKKGEINPEECTIWDALKNPKKIETEETEEKE